ncbi:aliphatic sulfonate ABC transporter substrate-binding protein [Acinetobacter radioresistens]|jgi:sulfonate transport system substrate-binding protein|uniref:aliphatic sulfonate ABC transporter substrate-binding protein n=1 Tax=Acinetobacter radioresistens TaxID=40216 RepID=UPI000E711EED|nr:aliphatic sulfonate ABC transporter substrate-binding protein [Acinetobacter radioresistens]MCK4088271.1 aliphatic sulfonate ABC transporter substrate-binding protein [Acinetobacter radioresistens]MCK4108294.1 aliphatic sulfonate ABC transporter substrate-binding protein [Acinetobacter radioresistens]MCX0331038.1 aliphatic sulfonate ABC transporter substrate-binding protein [Acinetobacter radioresistens]RJL75152.1 aliphatic sulfonate ABC transporter substrate-binding protein [Acinetobacter r
MYSLKNFLISSFIALGLSGCQKTSSDTAPGQQSVQEDNLKTLAVGYQKSSLNLLVARQQQLFEQQFPGVQVAWKEFPAGPQMLEALAVGAIDFGAVGNTPPVFAQAAGKDLKYIGYEVVPQNAQALLIPADSSIRTLADLKGKRIAVQKGSSAHELLAKALQKAGLSWQDIQPIWLPPADARAAFDKQSIDAWSIWEPYLSAAELDAKAKVLIDGQAFARTYSFYIANPQFIEQHPGATEKILQSLNTADQWVLQHQQQALKIYQQSTGLKQNIAQRVIDKRLKPSPIYSLEPEVVQAQQEIADLFQQVKLIPKSIQVSQVVWVPTPKN